jgi:hypothetical protein
MPNHFLAAARSGNNGLGRYGLTLALCFGLTLGVMLTAMLPVIIAMVLMGIDTQVGLNALMGIISLRVQHFQYGDQCPDGVGSLAGDPQDSPPSVAHPHPRRPNPSVDSNYARGLWCGWGWDCWRLGPWRCWSPGRYQLTFRGPRLASLSHPSAD